MRLDEQSREHIGRYGIKLVVAAAIAFVSSGWNPFAPISTSSAAAVVPPGEVTFWRRVALV